MAWRIPTARCPRCGATIRRDDLEPIPVEWALTDEDAMTLWPRGRDDVPASVTTCAACSKELRRLYEDQCWWEREARAYDDN